MTRMDPIAHAEFDIVDSPNMGLTFFKPRLHTDKHAWGCEFEFGAPLNKTETVFGENSLQALLLALKIASTILYGSDLYKEKRIGVFGDIGGKLILPATQALLEVAPYPF